MSWIQELVSLRGRKVLISFVGLLLLSLAFILPDPLAQNLDARFSPISLPYSLGTDQLGRDLFSRLYFGAIHSVGLILLTMIMTLAISIPAGLLAAKYQWAESILNIIAGAVWSIPTFIIALIVFVGLKGEWIEVKFVILGFFNWVPIFRSVRDVTKQVQKAYYVVFSRAIGMSSPQLYTQQILPNVMPIVYPMILLNSISLVEVEFVLSFLGLSYSDPSPTLGGVLRQGIEYLNFNMMLLPSMLLCIAVQILIDFERK
jgi:ABC-type dipeptide/oligopeptide/nickel transport system permease subunit